MHITELKTEGLKQFFTVTIPHDRYETLLKEQIMHSGKNAKIAGFRPGKVPFAMLEQRYAQSAKYDVLDKCCGQAVEHLIKEKNLKPALQPVITPGTFEDGQDFKIDITVEVLPEIKPIDLDKLKFEKTVCDIPQKKIDETYDNIRKSHAVPGESLNAAAKIGNVVVIDFVGRLKDGKHIQGGSGNDMPLELGSATFIPGFEDQLVGAKKDETRTVVVSFPTSYHEKTLAGKEAIFDVKVNKVCLTELPELDDTLATKVGFKSMDELKGSLEGRLRDECDRLSLLVSKRRILDYFADHFKFNVPQGLVELEHKTILQQYQQQTGKSLDDSDEKQQYLDIAERRVRLGLLLTDIGRQYEVQVSQNELENALMQIVRRYPGQEKQIFEYYRNNRDALASLKAPIFEDKVVQLILEKANPTETKVSFSELENLVRELTQDDEDDASVTSDVNNDHDHVHGPNCGHDH